MGWTPLGSWFYDDTYEFMRSMMTTVVVVELACVVVGGGEL